MQKQLQKRLEELKAEFEKGQQKLQGLETEAANLRNTLVRITGAIQVLEEELNKNNNRDDNQSQTPGSKAEKAKELPVKESSK